ncbi:MAG TPA: hypothetical protein VL053_18005 [Arachidicoccus sp.]|nr:hypothetical protein [Arachidicoccus sp.]
MEKEDKQFIDHLAEQLRTHELPYKEGSWEKFQLQESTGGRSRPARVFTLLKPWVGVAAAALLMVAAGLYYYNTDGRADNGITRAVTHTALNQPPDNYNTQPLQQPLSPASTGAAKRGNAADAKSYAGSDADGTNKPGQSGKDIEEFTTENNNKEINTNGALARNAENQRVAAAEQMDPLTEFSWTSVPSSIVSTTIPKTSSVQSDPQRLVTGIEKLRPAVKTMAPAQIAIAGFPGSDPQQLPAAQSQRTPQVAKRGSAPIKTPAGAATKASSFNEKGYFDPEAPRTAMHKWNMGVMVIPAVGNDSKLNLGYGVSVGYRLNNRLSLNSGLAYTEMSGSKTPGPQESFASSARTLSSIEANVTGLNLPLELRYHISKKIYVGAGVSALAVLSNDVQRNYGINTVQSTAFVSKNGNLLNSEQLKAIASNLKTKEVIPENQVGGKDFAGFMNFSFGFNQKLNKKKSISIEPFISVPMSNNLNNQQIRMTDGGIRIKLGL